ncbi:MAG: hypothetical protein IPP57_14410 [Candidatus Obscuribacter sp.]|nr:hypothetical protein [Candidatus Obscuribacter sp.]MBK7838563.1 hypothetical protein [Candidatus Obscuribacter sp.]MBK9200920.1 hypothetical protein [Candidatus Obscuribacter sp.]MBK9621602.1 hypothetical protein [Candidatus Obscuribacter sp.]MBK9771988.1 hypothetical protein [Candidatus Obscuribacter sp.]
MRSNKQKMVMHTAYALVAMTLTMSISAGCAIAQSQATSMSSSQAGSQASSQAGSQNETKAATSNATQAGGKPASQSSVNASTQASTQSNGPYIRAGVGGNSGKRVNNLTPSGGGIRRAGVGRVGTGAKPQVRNWNR